MSTTNTQNKKWKVYILKCESNMLYTGITTNVSKRLTKHVRGLGAKFTVSYKPQQLMYLETGFNRSEALKREYEIKQLSKSEKENLINNLRSKTKNKIEQINETINFN